MRAAGRDVVERLNQPGQMPTTYANPIPGLRLFHGSPHDFDKFSMGKIGTGEGAQAYGHGLYFAENEGIARSYRDALSPSKVAVDGRVVDSPVTRAAASFSPSPDDYIKALMVQRDRAAKNLEMESAASDPELGDIMGLMSDIYRSEISDIDAKIAELRPLSGGWFHTKPDGRMYEVSVNANPEDFLDWDKPLSEQPQRVRDALGRIGITSADTGNEAYMRSSLQRFAIMKPDGTFGPGPDTYDEALALVGGDPSKVRRISEGSAPMRSEALRREGIPGIRYLDAGSRSAGDGSRNYVVFDENLIEIVRKYGIAGAAAMLGISQADVAQAMQQQQQPQPQGLLSGAQ
jgi:hypothetical protein